MRSSLAAQAVLGKTSRFGDLKSRALFLLGALIVYRMGAHIPVPGIDSVRLAEMFKSQGTGILAIFNMFSGGALSRFTIFALGVMPYISASIIVQLLSVALPSLEQLRKEGEAGRKKVAQYTRYATLCLAIFQSFGISVLLQSNGLAISDGFLFRLTTVVTLVTGSMYLMWLGEQMTERGLGNGISVLIFSSIVSGLPNSVAGVLELVRTGSLGPLTAIFIFIIVAATTLLVIFVERGQRRILINYARHQVSGRGYTAQQSSHLPFKLNMAGVIPPIFASSIILFPATLASWLGSGENFRWLKDVAAVLSPGQPVYIAAYAVAIVFFCFFYTALVYSPRETADNLKRGGALVPGIRPGEQTARYLEKVLLRLTLAGSVYIAAVCLLPEFINLQWNVPFYFGGTSLLIVVVVTMDFMAQVQTYVMPQKYSGLLKKASFRK